MKLLEATISFFERLGVCVAVFAGGGAIIFYQDKVFPLWPTGAMTVGLMLIFTSLFLCVLVAANYSKNISTVTSKKPVQYILTSMAVIISIFFVMAGGSAALSSNKPNPPIKRNV